MQLDGKFQLVHQPTLFYMVNNKNMNPKETCPKKILDAMQKLNTKWRGFYASFNGGTFPLSELPNFANDFDEIVFEFCESVHEAEEELLEE